MKLERCGEWVRKIRQTGDIAEIWFRVEQLQIYEGQRGVWVVALGSKDNIWETQYCDTESEALEFAREIMGGNK